MTNILTYIALAARERDCNTEGSKEALAAGIRKLRQQHSHMVWAKFEAPLSVMKTYDRE